jgi:hypothetical protein
MADNWDEFEKVDEADPWADFETVDENQPAAYQGSVAGPWKTVGMSLASAVPFGQKITSAVPAALISPFVPETFGELYNQGQQYQKAAAEENPKAALGGTVVGTLATLPLASKTIGAWAVKPVTHTGGFVGGTANLLGTMVKGAAVAAPTGALYSAGEAESMGDMPGATLEGAKTGATWGAALPVAFPLVRGGYNMTKELAGAGMDLLRGPKRMPVTGANVRHPTIGSESAKAIGQDLYEASAVYGGEFGMTAGKRLADELDDFAVKTGPYSEVVRGQEPKINQIITRFKEALNSKKLTIEDFNNVDNDLSDLMDTTRDKFGNLSKEGAAFLRLQRKLRDHVTNPLPGDAVDDSAFEAMRSAAKVYSNYFKLRDLEHMIDRSARTATPGRSLRTAANNFVTNEAKLLGWSDDEIKLLRETADGNALTDLMNVFSSKLNPIMGFVSGGLSHAAPAYALSLATGKIGRELSERPMRKLTDLIGKKISEEAERGQQFLRAKPETPPPLALPNYRYQNKVAAEAERRAREERAMDPYNMRFQKPIPLGGQKLLPAPSSKYETSEMIVPTGGTPRPAVFSEQASADAERLRRSGLGLTPDVSKAQDDAIRRAVNEINWSQVEKSIADKRAKELEDLFTLSESQRPNVRKLIEEARLSVRESSEAIGQPHSPTQMEEAFKNARPRKLSDTIKPKKGKK